MGIETLLFQSFVVPSKKQRYAELLRTDRGRDKIRLSLDHFGDLDPRFCRRLGPVDDSFEQVLALLRERGAPPKCRIISADDSIDGREMLLTEALSAIYGRGVGTFISCIPGVLAYFEGEEPRERYMCHRKAAIDQA